MQNQKIEHICHSIPCDIDILKSFKKLEKLEKLMQNNKSIQFLLHQLANNEQDRERFNSISKKKNLKLKYSKTIGEGLKYEQEIDKIDIK
jgi:hypothetical protein